MVVQIISYQTGEHDQEDFRKVMEEMKQYYIRNGCIGFEVFKDAAAPNKVYEVAYFKTRGDSSEFDAIATNEKNELYKRFAVASKIMGDRVELKVLESI